MPVKSNSTDALNALMPARRARAVTPTNDAALALGVCDYLWIGGTGAANVNVILEDDTAAVLFKVVGPCRLDVRAKSVQATGTTATDIVACY